jgi:hypothetical protein
MLTLPLFSGYYLDPKNHPLPQSLARKLRIPTLYLPKKKQSGVQ